MRLPRAVSVVGAYHVVSLGLGVDAFAFDALTECDGVLDVGWLMHKGESRRSHNSSGRRAWAMSRCASESMSWTLGVA